jgi:hypothetical protein
MRPMAQWRMPILARNLKGFSRKAFPLDEGIYIHKFTNNNAVRVGL